MTRISTDRKVFVEVCPSVSVELLNLVQDELAAVEAKLKSQSPIMREVDPIGSLELTPMERVIRPGIVLLAARMFGQTSDRVNSLGAMVQFIYLARLMRENISEQPGEEHGESSALPVLLGDYFYGRLLVLAVESGLAHFLTPLSEAVCRSAENITRGPGDPLMEAVVETVRHQIADLFAEAMLLTATLLEVSPGEREAMRRFGLNLGMGYGLMSKGAVAEAGRYRKRALTKLDKLPAGPAREALGSLVRFILSPERAGG